MIQIGDQEAELIAAKPRVQFLRGPRVWRLLRDQVV